MKEFKVGDKVYHLDLTGEMTGKILTVERNEYSSTYPISVDDCTFTKEGKYYDTNVLQSLIHATPENHRMLERLFGAEFERPPIKLTSKEIIQALLNRGVDGVPCWVSSDNKNPNKHNHWVYIRKAGINFFTDMSDEKWAYATPFDPTTGEAITELP